jgi:hypothetical protein
MTKVKRAHGVNCVYLPAWMFDQFEPGQHVIFYVKNRKVHGKVCKNGKKIIIILPHFLRDGEEVTRVGEH